jgi:serine/threonine protein kinase
MAPEYRWGGEISSKCDVFSLGVMIVQIIAGKEGYSKLGEMSIDSHFIELVREEQF